MNAGNAAGAYSVRAGDAAADEEVLLSLWRSGLAQQGKPRAKLNWYYQHNAEGTPELLLLDHAGSAAPVGAATIGPRRMRIGGVEHFCGAMIDFVTLPDHRTFFPAITLQREIHARGLRGHALLFGFPNLQSTPILKRVGYRCLGQFVRRVRVLRSGRYLARHLPGWLAGASGAVADLLLLASLHLRRLSLPAYRAEWADRPDDSFDALWPRTAVPGLAMGLRDQRFLAWRFSDCPFQKFRFFTVRRGGALVAYAACVEDEEGALAIHDFLLDPADAHASATLWTELALAGWRMNASSLSLEFMGSDEAQQQLAAAGLRVRGERPVFGGLNTGIAPTAWYLTSADDDS